MSTRALGGSRQRSPHGWAGKILDNAASATDTVRVTIPAFGDSRAYFGPMPFMPRGAVLPVEGDPCMVIFDEDRAGRIVFWEPA